MSDFNFEELDKAVAGVLSTEADEVTPAPAPIAAPEPRPVIDSTPPSNTTPTPPTPSATHALEVPARPTTFGPPAARRSSGRFMDVVHPSSDMRSRPTFTPPQITPKEVKPVPAPVVTEAPVKEDDVNSTAFDGMSYEDSWNKPSESPFLPDAKVEKRPLGGFGSPNIPLDTLEEQLLLEVADEPRLEAHTMPDPIDFAAHASAIPSESEDTGDTLTTPEELEALLGHTKPDDNKKPIETIEPALDLTTEPEQPVEPQPMQEIETEVEHVESTENTETTEPVEVTTPTEPTPAPASASIGSGSITQQYTEQKNTEEVASGSIYDTEAYHQPLPVTVKKRSGAWIFVWILALIIFGAGAGVVFYLYILPLI